MHTFVIYGTGGHARVVKDLVELNGGRVSGYFDDQSADACYDTTKFAGDDLIIAIGNNHVRQKISENVHHQFGTLIHPHAIVASDVQVGEGTVILAGAVVQANAKIGRHVIVNASACIDHDAVIEDYVHISPFAYIGGGAVIRSGVLIKPGEIILRNTEVK